MGWDSLYSESASALQDFITSTCGRENGDDCSYDVFTANFSVNITISKGALAEKKNELAGAGA